MMNALSEHRPSSGRRDDAVPVRSEAASPAAGSAERSEPGVHAAAGGTVLRGNDGALYFVRDELLPALRVAGEGLDKLEAELAATSTHDVARVAVAHTAGPGPRSVGYVRGSLLSKDPENATMSHAAAIKKVAAASTVMCPWLCGVWPE